MPSPGVKGHSKDLVKLYRYYFLSFCDIDLFYKYGILVM